jgi:hypothetical protein
LDGGAILANGGALVITDSAFTQNVGGAIIIGSTATATITNTTFARNATITLGTNFMAIQNVGVLHLYSDTFAENSGADGIPAAFTLVTAPGATTIMQNTLLARSLNDLGNPVPDCSGPVMSLGYNLIGDPTGCNINLQLSDLVGDPGLDTFQDNGQPGNGHFPLLPSSRAIDTGAVPCPKWDQIGQRRIRECDTGAIAFHD